MLIFYITFSVLISFFCNSLLLRFSQSLGIRNKNDVIVRWSNQSKPSLGGISFYAVFIFTIFSYVIYENQINVFNSVHFSGFVVGTTLAFFMGLSDDAYNTKPLLKLTIQILCGVILVYTGTTIDLFHQSYIDAFLTVIWVVALMNSLNMLDNMDGITATTSVFILLSCLLTYWFIHGYNLDIWTICMLTCLGSLFGFLYFNIHPSKIFMGDAGSQFIGFFVAFFSIKILWNIGPLVDDHSWTGLVITLLAFTPAAVDSITVSINRIKAGKSPMVGGKDHTTHHLVYAGKNDRQVWYIFTFIGFLGLVFSLTAVILVIQKILWPIPLFLIFFVIVFYYLYRNTIRFKP